MSTVGAARLERLELENFRGFERLSLDFEDDFTVLVGANGAGKTTIVDALVLAIGPTWRGSGKANSSPATFPKPTNVRHGTTSARIRLTCGADGEHATLSSEYLHDARRFASADRRLSRPPRALVYRARRDVRDETSTAAEQSWAGSAMDRWDDASAAYKVFFLWFKDTEDLENEQDAFSELADVIEDASDEAEFDRADALLAKLDELVPGGADPEIVYYRNILARLREQ